MGYSPWGHSVGHNMQCMLIKCAQDTVPVMVMMVVYTGIYKWQRE